MGVSLLTTQKGTRFFWFNSKERALLQFRSENYFYLPLVFYDLIFSMSPVLATDCWICFYCLLFIIYQDHLFIYFILSNLVVLPNDWTNWAAIQLAAPPPSKLDKKPVWRRRWLKDRLQCNYWVTCSSFMIVGCCGLGAIPAFEQVTEAYEGTALGRAQWRVPAP